MRIWAVMDECIRSGVSTTETTLPGRLNLRRRAPILYRRLMRGFYPGVMQGVAFPAIDGGETPVGFIDSPEEHMDASSATSSRQEVASPRPARVIARSITPFYPCLPCVDSLIHEPTPLILLSNSAGQCFRPWISCRAMPLL